MYFAPSTSVLVPFHLPLGWSYTKLTGKVGPLYYYPFFPSTWGENSTFIYYPFSNHNLYNMKFNTSGWTDARQLQKVKGLFDALGPDFSPSWKNLGMANLSRAKHYPFPNPSNLSDYSTLPNLIPPASFKILNQHKLTLLQIHLNFSGPAVSKAFHGLRVSCTGLQSVADASARHVGHTHRCLGLCNNPVNSRGWLENTPVPDEFSIEKGILQLCYSFHISSWWNIPNQDEHFLFEGLDQFLT